MMEEVTNEAALAVKRTRENANGQGTYYWVSSRNRYVAQIHDIYGIRRSKVCKTKKECQLWLEEQKRARHFGNSTYSLHSKQTVAEFLNGWVELPKSSGSPETKRGYKNVIKNHINPAMGTLKVNSLSPHAIEQLMSDMHDKNYGFGTIKLAYAVLRASFNYAVKMGDLTNNPVKKVTPPTGQFKSLKHIPHKDFVAIYEQAQLNGYTHARVELGMMVGLRPGEIYGLKWSDIDFEQQTITIERQLQRVSGKGLVFRPVKQKEVRTLHLTDSQIEILKAHKFYQELETSKWVEDFNLVFPNSIGRPLDRKRDSEDWNKLLSKAKVGKYTIYQMRKTAFTNFASLSPSIPSMLAFTGHSNTSTVMNHYAFSKSEEMEGLLAKMDEKRPKMPFNYENSIVFKIVES
jgi:integrase